MLRIFFRLVLRKKAHEVTYLMDVEDLELNGPTCKEV
mgnify:CR=1 FL=1